MPKPNGVRTKPPAASKRNATGSRKSSTRRLKPKPVTPDRGEAASLPRFPKSFPGYKAATDWLYDRINVERARPSQLDKHVFKLERMKHLMEALGDVHRAFRSVHVAGSKGKGSTCEMTASSLQGCGYTVGLYTSPHLVDVRERIRINQQLISEDDFTRLLAKVSAAAEKVAKDHGEATFFELLTALCFLHFAEQAVDIAVIEVGLGGRLDATNVITPEVAAITSIQLEHKEILGDTIEKIAREKAGIFKPGVPALTYAQQPAVMTVFREVAAEIGCPLFELGKEIDFSYRFEANNELGPHVRVCLNSNRSNFEHLPVPLKGEHQAHNAGLALAIVDKLRERGFETPERKVASGLSSTPNHGRLEFVWNQPRIIVDGAHNPESIGALMRSIGSHIRYDSMVVIFGCAADKDIPGMLAKLSTGADKIIFTRSDNNPRAVDPRDLQRRFADVSHKMTQITPDLKTALNLAARAVGRDDLICVTGSFYLAGEAKQLLLEKKNRPAESKSEAKPATPRMSPNAAVNVETKPEKKLRKK
jgi:dihydrofolate synthase/folylpolyglutamate synthase